MNVDAERPARHGGQIGLANRQGPRGHVLIFPACPAPTFAHRERKSAPVRAGGDNRGRIAGVTVARNSSISVPLVARRHVDFKRVCSCCCLS
ncbi:Ms4527A family Cys-rich leader peptide [Mycobacterium sp. 155]|uniref:Ms4527A family Cys-rich leader peptide n=1 Tax=Mycobacterium sp. 155 TaxID=1157943 RepID=UPI00350FA8F7